MKRSRLIFLFSLFLSLTYITSLSAQGNEGILYYKVGYLEQAKTMLETELASGSGDKTQLYYYLGNVYFKLNQPEKAAEAYQQGLSSDPKDLYNAIGLAKLKIKSNPSEATTQFKDIQKKAKKDLNVIVEIGRAYLDNKEPDAALDFQTAVYNKNFQYAPAYILWGDIFDFKSEAGDAASKYEMAITIDPSSYDAYIKYARVINHVNMEAGIEKLQELKQQAPSLSIVDKELSELYYKKNDFANAATAYSNYIKAGNYTNDDLKQYAVTLLFAGNHEESLKIAKEGLQKDPTDPAFSRMVMYNLVDLERYDEAASAADNFFNKSKNPEFSYFDYMYQGRMYDAQEKYEEAGNAFLKAIEKEPTNKQLYQMASRSFDEAGDVAKSLELLEKYINESEGEKDPDDLMDLGRKYYTIATSSDSVTVLPKEEALDKAITIFSQVGTLEPDNYRSFFWKGNALSVKDPEATTPDAKESYTKALEIIQSKDDIERYSYPIRVSAGYLSVYYYKENERNNDDASKANSLKYAKEVLEFDPENPVAKQLVEIFGDSN